MPLTTWYDGNLDAAATGSYNEHYLKAAQAIAATTPGTEPIYIRTGWEMNGTWFPWSAQGHEQAFVGAFQQFVDTFRSVSDRFKFEWTPNVGNDWFVHPADAYPGDAYVDVIGMDFYWNTQWEGTDPVGAWNSLVTRSSGLQWQQDFAAAHGKPTAISEWGTSSSDAGPFFQKAGQWFTQHNMLYQSYWDYTDGSYAGKLDSGQFPEAGAVFQQTFGTLNHPPTVAGPLTGSVTVNSPPASFDLLSGASDPDIGDTLVLANLTYSVDGTTPSAVAPAGIIYDPTQHCVTVNPADPAFAPFPAGTQQTIVLGYDIADGQRNTVHQTETITITGAAAAKAGGTLVIRVSGDSYEGDPQFIVKVDDQQVGGVYSAHAAHASGAHDDIAIQGAFSANPNKVTVEFINDLYGGTAATDRNLYVEQLTLNGHTVAGSAANNTSGWNTADTAQLFSNGNAVFNFATPRQNLLTLRVSGDSYEGDPQFIVKVDDQQVGGVYSAHAAHASGAHDDIAIQGAFSANPNKVTVEFINDLYGGTAATDRNLYVEQLTLNGHTVAGSAANNTSGWNTADTAQLFSNGNAYFYLDTIWHI
ncbi:carbohydrate-binding domain-containing protein [Methylobacterium nigriterrae]|uniref:carbohydrate-binding domain-containing protein n=1 Tax=Methylobacterium nigriterrae TaxID=3127512 RepID=UPI0030136164